MPQYEPLKLYYLQESDKIQWNISGIKTELIQPLIKALQTEIYLRTSKVSFKDEREEMNLVIEPKQLTLKFKK